MARSRKVSGKKPVKFGSKATNKSGGILTFKVVKIMKKNKGNG